jgi:hypothetical protein
MLALAPEGPAATAQQELDVKATLSFNLSDEGEKISFNCAVKAFDLARVISDFDEGLRRRLKYESDNFSEKELELLQTLRSELTELQREYEVLGIDG